MAKIDIKGTSATVYSDKDMDFISLTDMVRDIENGLVLTEKWLRNKNTIEFLGSWEAIYNPGFNSPEFEGIKNQAGLNRFALSVKQWVENQAVAGREPRQQGQYPRRSQCRPTGVPRQSLNPERAFHPARIAARGAAAPAEPDGHYWSNETVVGGYRGTEAGREQQMTQRLQAEFVQQPVGLLLESLKTSLLGTELIEREWQACRHAGREGYKMVLENRLNITNQVELAKAEEKISKQKARQLFDSGDIARVEVGTFAGLSFIHAYLFEDIYAFAGKIREVNIAKGNFRFVPLMYLRQALEHIDAMAQGSFDAIIEKYVEMNIAHPFREGNGRATRIWLDLLLKKEIRQVIDWNLVDKEEYLSAMQRSVVKDIEIKALLKQALTDQIDDRALFMKGIDVSYHYEGYSQFKTEEL